MIERSRFKVPNYGELVEELDSLILNAGRVEFLWDAPGKEAAEVGLTHHKHVTPTNEDKPYADINTHGSVGRYPDAHGHVELAEWKLVKALEGTSTEDYYNSVRNMTPDPFETGRVKLIKVEPGVALHMQYDIGYMWHLALHTDPNVLVLVNGGDGFPKRMVEGNLPMMRAYHVAADGHPYILDGTKFYTIVNAGSSEAIHLVVETNQSPRKQPKWTGTAAEKMTGHQNFLDQDLRLGTMFYSDREIS